MSRRFGSRATEGHNQGGGVLQQPTGLWSEGRCGATIPCPWSTVRHGFGVARPNQHVGELVYTLPRAKCGDLQDQVKYVIGGASVRGGNSSV